jgi:hypothetical protein
MNNGAKTLAPPAAPNEIKDRGGAAEMAALVKAGAVLASDAAGTPDPAAQPPVEHVALTAEEKQLLDKIPLDGSAIGNHSIRRELGWDVEMYWRVRNPLIDKELISTKKGRGGSVYRVGVVVTPKLKTVAAQEDKTLELQYELEKDLYPPFEREIDKWAKDESFSNYFIQRTANQGGRKTGGTWTRPDFVMVSVEAFQYVPDKHLEVITFEVKPASEWKIAAVFETAAHSRFASQSYLALHKSPDFPVDEELASRMEEECKRFGVGMIVFDDPADYDTYNVIIDSARNIPDPREIEKFMEQVSTMNRAKLSKWLR